jgi:hypothetical protein
MKSFMEEMTEFRTTKEYLLNWVHTLENCTNGAIENLNQIKNLSGNNPTYPTVHYTVEKLVELVNEMADKNKCYHPNLYKLTQQVKTILTGKIKFNFCQNGDDEPILTDHIYLTDKEKIKNLLDAKDIVVPAKIIIILFCFPMRTSVRIKAVSDFEEFSRQELLESVLDGYQMLFKDYKFGFQVDSLKDLFLNGVEKIGTDETGIEMFGLDVKTLVPIDYNKIICDCKN